MLLNGNSLSIAANIKGCITKAPITNKPATNTEAFRLKPISVTPSGTITLDTYITGLEPKR